MAFRPARRRAGVAVRLICGVLGLVLSGSLLAVGSSSARPTSAWRDCGTYDQAPSNGYVSIDRVQERDGVPCSIASHIALHFSSGGYSYKGLTCFYAAMGSGNPYWNWTCGLGAPADRYGTRNEIRGHLVVRAA